MPELEKTILIRKTRSARHSKNLSASEQLMYSSDFFFPNAQMEQFLMSGLEAWLSKSLIHRHQTHLVSGVAIIFRIY